MFVLRFLILCPDFSLLFTSSEMFGVYISHFLDHLSKGHELLTSLGVW